MILTKKVVKNIAQTIGLDLNIYPPEMFKHALEVELEHGLGDLRTNVTDDNLIITGRIALAHILEIPDYYQRLLKMEKEADRYWKNKEKPNFLIPQ